MPGLLPDVDPDGLLEYSVVYNDRTLNHMSRSFRSVMNEISAALKRVYNARAVVVVPGSGTYGMEAVARQFATGQSCLVIRNGWFSFRWTQILDMGAIPSGQTVLKARQVGGGSRAPFAPAPIEEVVSAIAAERPGIVFAPHVETASGMILPDDYVRRVADAVHRGRRHVRARRHSVGCRLGGHGGLGRRRAAQRAAEGLDGLAVLRTRHAGRARARAPGRDHEHELLLRPEEVAGDHAGVRGRGSRVPRDHAHGRAPHPGRRYRRDGALRARRGVPRVSTSWAAGSASSSWGEASRAWLPRASRHPGSW